MALKMNVVDENGNTHVNAYLKVANVGGSKEMMTALLFAYDNSGDENHIWIKRYSFVPTVSENSKNFIAQAYKYIKSQAEYSGAEDC